MVGVAAGGESVEGRIVNDVDIRHLGQAAGDGHLLDDVKESRMVLLLDLLSAGGSQQDAIALVIGHQGHDNPYHGGNGDTAVGTAEEVFSEREAYPDEDRSHKDNHDNR